MVLQEATAAPVQSEHADALLANYSIKHEGCSRREHETCCVCLLNDRETYVCDELGDIHLGAHPSMMLCNPLFL